MRIAIALAFAVIYQSLSGCGPLQAALAQTKSAVQKTKGAPAASQMIGVWKVEQENAFGSYVIYAGPASIRIEGSSGGRIVARAPDWTVKVFNIKDKRACLVPYRDWILKVPGSSRISLVRQKPVKDSIAGISVMKYKFPVGGVSETDGGLSSLYKARVQKQFIKSRAISVAADNHNLPEQIVEIWRCTLESFARGSILIQVCEETSTGQQVKVLNTTAQKSVSVPSSMFDFPSGYKHAGGALSVFFGSEIEDAAKMLLGE